MVSQGIRHVRALTEKVFGEGATRAMPQRTSELEPPAMEFSLATFVQELPRPAGHAFLTETPQARRGSKNRLDFCRKGRIAMGAGRWTWPPGETLRARLAMCGALGRASVNSGAANQRSPNDVDPFHKIPEPQERRT